MATMTVRDKNQVTLPARLLEQIGLRPGAPIEFTALPDGGIGVYPFGTAARRESVLAAARRWAEAVPGIEDTELELPPRDLATREVDW